LHDASSTFNETSMQVTGLYITTVLAVSKHITYSLFPVVYFRVVMLIAGWCCAVVSSFSRHCSAVRVSARWYRDWQALAPPYRL